MATYLNNLVTSAWTGWSGLFEVIPYGDPYISVVTLFVLVGMSARMLTSGWR